MHERLTVMRWFLMSNNLQSNLHAGIWQLIWAPLTRDLYISVLSMEMVCLIPVTIIKWLFLFHFLSLYVTFKGRINFIHEASPSNRLKGPCVINGILAGMRSPIIKVDAMT